MPDPVAIPIPEPGVNPVMTDEGTHYGVARFAFAPADAAENAGALHQLFMPCDWSVNVPEWRPVPFY